MFLWSQDDVAYKLIDDHHYSRVHTVHTAKWIKMSIFIHKSFIWLGKFSIPYKFGLQFFLHIKWPVIKSAYMLIGGPCLNGSFTMYRSLKSRWCICIKWFSHVCSSSENGSWFGSTSTSQNFCFSCLIILEWKYNDVYE